MFTQKAKIRGKRESNNDSVQMSPYKYKSKESPKGNQKLHPVNH